MLFLTIILARSQKVGRYVIALKGGSCRVVFQFLKDKRQASAKLT
jgi:hypothetical protein